MKRFRQAVLVSILPTLLLLANCSGLQTSTPTAVDFSRSAPAVGSASRLLFITDRGDFDVVIYSLPDLKLEGRITGSRPAANR